VEKELEQGSLELVLNGVTIPSPPQIIADLQLLMLDPNPDIKDIAKLIEQDPGLAGGVLKVTNSPIFGTNRIIHSISEAVMLLGLKTVNNVVNTLCLRSELADGDFAKNHAEFLNKFWDSCSDIAAISMLVAERTGNKALCDDAYLLGLFHNVGIVLLMKRFDNYESILMKSYNIGTDRVIDFENTHMNTNHSVVGYFVSKSWKTPKNVSEAISTHHSIFDALSSRNRNDTVKVLISILKVAEHLSGFYKTVAGQAENYEWGTYENEVLIYLGLTQDDIDDLASLVNELGMGTAQDIYY